MYNSVLYVESIWKWLSCDEFSIIFKSLSNVIFIIFYIWNCKYSDYGVNFLYKLIESSQKRTHLDIRRKFFDLQLIFFLPFSLLCWVSSHFIFVLVSFCALNTPNKLEAGTWCCCSFFEVVKFCRKQNITLRVIDLYACYKKHNEKSSGRFAK